MLPKPATCEGCPCPGEGFSQPEGRGTLGVLVVGEALGEHEKRDGLPFRPHAPAGSVLEGALNRVMWGGAPVGRDRIRLWNIVACQPKGNWLDGAPWEQGAIEYCRPNLDRLVHEMQPKCLLALGGVALRSLTGLAGPRLGIQMLRGFVLDSRYGVPVVGTYHPSYLRRGSRGRQEETGAKVESGAGKGGMHLLPIFYFDILKAVGVAQFGSQKSAAPKYQTSPGLDDAWSFYYHVKDNPALLVAADIETFESASIDEDELDSTGTVITQIQFSTSPSTGIVLPWEGKYKEVAHAILATSNTKAGHNWWKFDAPRLRAADCKINGLVHDSMQIWKRYHPDVPAGLQFVASLCGFPFPWKHLAAADPGFYGACDVDAVQRIMTVLPEWMKQKGCWRSYEQHVLGLEPILARMSDRGLPIDDQKRIEFGHKLDVMADELHARIQMLVPEDVKPLHSPGGTGYRKDPKDAVEGGSTSHNGRPAIWGKRDFAVDAANPIKVPRWVKVLPFNPNSSDQIAAYIRFRGHPMPKERRTDRDTTSKLELKKLAKCTGDEFYSRVVEFRELAKLKGTYVDGFVPGSDGRIHSHFGHETGTGQLTSRRPNIQNAPKIGHGGGASDQFKTLATEFRSMVEADPGHWLVEFDFKSAHALTLGFEAQDPDYMRLARIDIHSFVAAAGLLKLEDPQKLLSVPDFELKARLKWYRKNWHDKTGRPFDHVRNVQAKPAILGYGFAMGPGTLYNNNPESFANMADAKRTIQTLDRLFSRQPAFRNRIRQLAARQTYLVSRHGFIRWFFDVGSWSPERNAWIGGDDAEACIAFLPANDAFGHIFDAMLRLEAQGWNERARLINQIHDALMFEIPDALMDEAIPAIKAEMERKSEVLVDPIVAPDGLWIETSVSVGRDWGQMEEIDAGTGWARKIA